MSKFLGLIGLRWILDSSRNEAGEGEEAQPTDATTPDEVEPQPVEELEVMDNRFVRSRSETEHLRQMLKENEFRNHRIQVESEDKSRHIRGLQEELTALDRCLRSETQRREYIESELNCHMRVKAEREDILRNVTEQLQMRNESLAKNRRDMERLEQAYALKSQESQDQYRSSQKRTKELEEKLDEQCGLLNNERANMQEEKERFQTSLQSKDAENQTLYQQLSEARKQLKMSEEQGSARAASDRKKYETLEKVLKTQIDKAKGFETKCNALILEADALRKSVEKQTVETKAERAKFQSMEKQYTEEIRKRESECVTLKQELTKISGSLELHVKKQHEMEMKMRILEKTAREVKEEAENKEKQNFMKLNELREVIANKTKEMDKAVSIRDARAKQLQENLSKIRRLHEETKNQLNDKKKQLENQTRISEMEKQRTESLEGQIRQQLDRENKMKSEVDTAINQTLQYRRKVTALKRKNASASKRIAAIEKQRKHYIIRMKRKCQGLKNILTNHKKSLTDLNRTLQNEASKSEEFEKQIQNKNDIIGSLVLNIQTSGTQLKEFRKKEKENDLSALVHENQVLKQKLSECTRKLSDSCKLFEKEKGLGITVAKELKLQMQREIETGVELRRSNVQSIELQKKIVSLEKELDDTKGNLSLMRVNHEKFVGDLISDGRKSELRICELQNLVKDQEKNLLEESNKLKLANEKYQSEVNLRLCYENVFRKKLAISKSTSVQRENELTLCKSNMKEPNQTLEHRINTLEEQRKLLESEKKKEVFEWLLNHQMEIERQPNSKMESTSIEKVQCEERLMLITKRLEESNKKNERLKRNQVELKKKSKSERKILDSKIKQLQTQMDEQTIKFAEEEKKYMELQKRIKQDQKILKHRNRQMKSLRTKYQKEKLKLSDVKKKVLRKFNYVKLCSAISEVKLAATVEMRDNKIVELEKKFEGLKKRLKCLLNPPSVKRRRPKVTKCCLNRQNIKDTPAGGDNIHTGPHSQPQLHKSGKGKMYEKPKDIEMKRVEVKATAGTSTAANQFQSLPSVQKIGINTERENERQSSMDGIEDGTGIVDRLAENVERRETEIATENVFRVSSPGFSISEASKNFVKLNPLRMDEVRVEELRNRLQPLQRSNSNDTKLGLQIATKQEIKEEESDERGKKHTQEDDTECQPTKRLKLDNKGIIETSVQVKCEPVDNYNNGEVTMASTSQQQVNRPIILKQLSTAKQGPKEGATAKQGTKEEAPVKQGPKEEASVSGNGQANNSTRYNTTTKEAELIHTFTPQYQNSTIAGITTLDGKLFLICKRSPEVEVFDAKNFSYEGSMTIEEFSDPVFITSCQLNRCLYVLNRGDTDNEIFQLTMASEWLLKKWSVGTDYGDLATTSRGTLLFSSYIYSVIKEFTVDGRLVREIRKIKIGARSGTLSRPKLYRAVELKSDSDGQLVVSYGKLNWRGIQKGCVRNICLLDRDEELGAFLWQGSSGSSVQHMVVGSSTGALFAVDFGLKDVLYWYPGLSDFRKIHLRKDPEYWPFRIAVDNRDRRMFIAEVARKDGKLTTSRISVYDIQC